MSSVPAAFAVCEKRRDMHEAERCAPARLIDQPAASHRAQFLCGLVEHGLPGDEHLGQRADAGHHGQREFVGAAGDDTQEAGGGLVAALGGDGAADQRAVLRVEDQKPRQVTGQHGERGVDHLFEQARVIDAPLGRLIERGFDPQDEVPHVDRLGDIVRRTGHQALGATFSRRARRDKDDGDVGGIRVVAQPAAHFDAVDVGHHHVEQDHVGRFAFGQGERLLAA
ncbi:MAG: hypothetical protein M5R40_22900 [Anaerolineae bacterium]|nr:hypothetical protein [Anaerolineae bacterium]